VKPYYTKYSPILSVPNCPVTISLSPLSFLFDNRYSTRRKKVKQNSNIIWHERSTLLPWWPLLRMWPVWDEIDTQRLIRDWNLSLGPLEWAGAETSLLTEGSCDREFPGFATVNSQPSRIFEVHTVSLQNCTLKGSNLKASQLNWKTAELVSSVSSIPCSQKTR